MSTQFVVMYHPQLGNRQVKIPLQAVATEMQRGWLLVDPGVTPPAPITPYITHEEADSRYLERGDVLDSGGKVLDTSLPARLSDTALRAAYVPVGQVRGRWVAAGDSHTASTGDALPTTSQTRHLDSYHFWTRYYLDGALTLAYNAGKNGDTSAALLARIPTDVVAQLPNGGICTVLIGTNDVIQGVPLATYQANVQQIVALLKAASITPVLLTIPPLGTPGSNPVTFSPSGSAITRTAAQLLQLNQINQWLTTWGRANGLVVVDLTTALTNPADATYLSNYTVDGVHAQPVGKRIIGKALAAALLPLIKPATPLLASSNVDPTVLNTNPLMLTNDGVLPTGFAASGAGSVTTTVGAVAGFRGSALTVSAWSRSTPARIVQGPLLAAATGDRLSLAYRYRSTGLQAKGLRPTVGIRGQGGSFSWVVQQWTEADTDGDHVVYIEGVITQASLTQVRVSIEPGNLGNADPTGTDAFVIGELTVRNLGAS